MDISTFVSVVIPVYNGANYLGEAVESVFFQTYPHIEIILVDDGSTDNTWDLIQAYGDRVRGIHKENGGVASALNAGILHARGELVAWLSHDDLFYPQKIERQVGFLLDHAEFGACYTDFEIIDVQHKQLMVYHAPWYPSSELPRRFLGDMHINGSTILFRKSCMEKVGWFNERLAHTQDMDMWLRFSEYSPIGHLGEVLLKSRSHPGQGSLNFELQISEEQAYFQAMVQRLGPAGVFPGLLQVKDPDKRERRGRELLADELFRHRSWYRFALEQYRLAARHRPSLAMSWKMTLCRFAIVILGDERDEVALARRARITLSQGNPKLARQTSARMLRRRPLRLDVWMIWLATWIPARVFELLRQVKRRVR